MRDAGPWSLVPAGVLGRCPPRPRGTSVQAARRGCWSGSRPQGVALGPSGSPARVDVTCTLHGGVFSVQWLCLNSVRALIKRTSSLLHANHPLSLQCVEAVTSLVTIQTYTNEKV